MRHAIPASLLLAVLVQSGFAVGQYLQAGQNGLGLNPGMAFGEEETAFGLGVGYSFWGRFDLMANYSRVSVETEGTPSFEFGGNNFGAGIMAHPLKEGETLPASLALSATYSHATYGGGDLEDLDIDGSANAYSLGAVLHRTLPLSSAFSLLFGAGYAWHSISVEMGAQEDNETANTFPLLIEGIFNLNGGAKLVLGPFYTIGEDANIFGLGLNYILPM